jgi:ABC-2 type transport system ATP-binding protein
MAPIIECRSVSKAFVMRTNRHHLIKDRALAAVRPHLRERREVLWALRDVDCAIEPGELFGVIGLNGAGKTTLFRIIAGLFVPTHGVCTGAVQQRITGNPDAAHISTSFAERQNLTHG